MAALHLALTAASTLAAAAVFAWTAGALARRHVSEENRPASRAFASFWALLAVQAASDAGRVLLGLAPPPDVDLFQTLVVVKILAAGAAVGAMTFYLAHLWGAPRAAFALPIPLALLHGSVFLWLFLRRLPAQVEVGGWTTRLVLSDPPLLNAKAQMLGTTLFFLPPLLFAAGYLLLWRRVPDRTGRARLAAVAAALLMLQGVAILLFDPDRGDSPLGPLLALVNVAASLLVLLAYRPPAWARRRWGLEPLRPAGLRE